ncbi:hypothetical protein [Pseudomonas sp. JUb96]|uniref:hypothetical protein n=1 Tax=Pseudomonas sp. JUb96 TaxID=2940539 RepID=UPI0022268B87|nr:hypothetical protein [Pseudomonas sp. JUb96]MCW2272363.1 hypothetical protein [Pseudomonas sp. JUb96]
MAVQYGLRTKDASGAITLDTSITPIRSLKMFTVTGNGSLDQYISVPEIKAGSFAVVDTLVDQGENTWTPQAWYSAGTLQLRRPSSLTWQVMVLSQGLEPLGSGSYGIRTLNNGIRTQIDAVNKVLSVAFSGSFLLGGPGTSFIQWGDVNFPAPITTTERPLIFLNAVDYMMAGSFYVKGSPGNWTGFRLKAWPSSIHGSAWTQYMTIKWFCATYQPDAGVVGQYGAVVRDANGIKLFATTTNLASLLTQPATTEFSAVGPPITGGSAGYSPSQQMNWTGSYDDYVLANALFSCSNIAQTTTPIKQNYGGWWPGNRSMLQMYCYNASGIDPLTSNGRTLFAARPMRPL